MDPINTGKRHRPNKSLFNGHVQVLLETIALSTGRLNNEAFIEILYARKEETVFFFIVIIAFANLGPIQLTTEITAKPFCWISTGSQIKNCVC